MPGAERAAKVSLNPAPSPALIVCRIENRRRQMISLTHRAPIVLAAALSLLAGAAQAESGPFTALNGTWSGGGTLTTANGTQDRLRCRASYTPGQGGEQL